MGAVRKTNTKATTPAASRPEICVRPPIWSFTAVREPLAPTGIPWLTAAARPAAPIAVSSAAGRMC